MLLVKSEKMFLYKESDLGRFNFFPSGQTAFNDVGIDDILDATMSRICGQR